jgi:hypothetical protein
VNSDYDAPGDFFAARSRKGGAMRYRRFETAADQIRELYDSAAYPFARAT